MACLRVEWRGSLARPTMPGEDYIQLIKHVKMPAAIE